jgi:hypothetical protein
MATDLTLPGSIPGLLRRGSPVVLPTGPGPTVLRVTDTTADVAMRRPREFHTGTVPLTEIALNLSEPEGVDRALRYVAAKTKSPASIGHSWARAFDSLRHWSIAGGVRGNGHSWSLTFHPGSGGVPALASIPLDDPNADVLALIAVVRHLAGVAS